VTTSNQRDTLAWFHCYAGIAGDMALGSLLDAGADVDEVRSLLGRIALPGWELTVESALRGGISCTRAIVRGDDDVVVRTHAHIAALIADAALPPRVTSRALAIFLALAEVESALHRRPVDQVHFHEVGGHDAIVDIVGTVAALEVLGIDQVSASAVATGTGTVRSAHGLLPNPSPAAVRLLRGAPTYGRDIRIELTTPTGAAILAALATSFGPMPPMVVSSSGFGGGAGEIDELPNCTQVIIGTAINTTNGSGTVGPGQPCLLLEANLDDATGEQLAYAVAAALESGAFDAWISPVTMKKGRPGHVLSVLVDPAKVDDLRQVIAAATGTFGVRATTVERWPSARRFDDVTIHDMVIRMKVGAGRAKPEFEDVARVATALGVPLHEVASQAEQAWRMAQAEQPAAPDLDDDRTPA
jgi:uncharacterized protein (TIGR00299 family) protein